MPRYLYVYIFRGDLWVLHKQLLCSSLGKTVSSVLTTSLVACGFSPRVETWTSELPHFHVSLSVDGVFIQVVSR